MSAMLICFSFFSTTIIINVFTSVTYDRSQNKPARKYDSTVAYAATVVSYGRKLFASLTPQRIWSFKRKWNQLKMSFWTVPNFKKPLTVKIKNGRRGSCKPSNFFSLLPLIPEVPHWPRARCRRILKRPFRRHLSTKKSARTPSTVTAQRCVTPWRRLLRSFVTVNPPSPIKVQYRPYEIRCQCYKTF
jgi:hypothetical protein